MIKLTRFNSDSKQRGEFILNAELIQTIETTPDTVITLVNEKKFIVEETAEEEAASEDDSPFVVSEDETASEELTTEETPEEEAEVEPVFDALTSVASSPVDENEVIPDLELADPAMLSCEQDSNPLVTVCGMSVDEYFGIHRTLLVSDIPTVEEFEAIAKADELQTQALREETEELSLEDFFDGSEKSEDAEKMLSESADLRAALHQDLQALEASL